MKQRGIKTIKKENIFNNKVKLKNTNMKNLNMTDLGPANPGWTILRTKDLSPNPRQNGKFEITSRARRGRKVSNNRKIKIDHQAPDGNRYFSPQNNMGHIDRAGSKQDAYYINENSIEAIDHYNLQNHTQEDCNDEYEYDIETKEIPFTQKPAFNPSRSNQQTQQKNEPTNFQKIGTFANRDNHKFSVLGGNRRNTQFDGHDTQMVVDNLTPFLNKRTLVSPEPEYTNKIRPYSPCDVSDFDEVNNSKTRMNQFDPSRKAISPQVHHNQKKINSNLGQAGHLRRMKSPIPQKKGANAFNFDHSKNRTPLLPSRNGKNMRNQTITPAPHFRSNSRNRLVFSKYDHIFKYLR